MTNSLAAANLEGWIPLAGQGNPHLEEMMVSYLDEHEVAHLRNDASPLKDYSAVVNTANKFPPEEFAKKVASCSAAAKEAEKVFWIRIKGAALVTLSFFVIALATFGVICALPLGPSLALGAIFSAAYFFSIFPLAGVWFGYQMCFSPKRYLDPIKL